MIRLAGGRSDAIKPQAGICKDLMQLNPLHAAAGSHFLAEFPPLWFRLLTIGLALFAAKVRGEGFSFVTPAARSGLPPR